MSIYQMVCSIIYVSSRILSLFFIVFLVQGCLEKQQKETETPSAESEQESECTETYQCSFGELVTYDCTIGYGGRCLEVTVCNETKYCYEAEEYSLNDCSLDSPQYTEENCPTIEEEFTYPEELWQELRSQIDQADINELVVMFGDRAGIKFVHEKGASADQTFPLASASKLLSSVLLMKLVENGTLSLNDQPQQYIEWWTNESEDPRSRITLTHLLSFTSGLTGESGLGSSNGIACVTDPDSNLDACSLEIYEGYFEYEPGTTFFYGPSHLQIAARMAEIATGETWNQLFRRLIYRELNLSGMTAYTIPSLQHPRVAGGAISTATDYAKVLTALADGTFLSPESLVELTKDRTPVGTNFALVPETADLFGDWHYAFGCWRECSATEYDASCDEQNFISSPGAFGFYPWFDQDHGYWGVIATKKPLSGPSLTVPLGQTWYLKARQALDLQ